MRFIAVIVILLLGNMVSPSLAHTRRKDVGNLLPIIKGLKFGYISRSGRIVVKPQFDSARVFSEGLARVEINGRYGFIDSSGRTAIKPIFNMANDFSDGLSAVKIPDGSCALCGEWVYINKAGQVVIHTRPIAGASNYVGDFSEGLASFYSKVGQPDFPRNLPYGYIDKHGKVVIPAKFGYAEEFHEGLAAVAKDFMRTAWGYINQQGEYTIGPRFSEVGDFQDGLAHVRIGGKWGYIDKAGQMIIEPQFEQASPFSEEYALVKLKNKFGYIDKSGTVVISPQFEWASDFSEGLAVAKLGAKTGYINKEGKFAIQLHFEADEYDSFSGGIAQVLVRYKVNYPFKIGYIDTKGSFIWKPTI